MSADEKVDELWRTEAYDFVLSEVKPGEEFSANDLWTRGLSEPVNAMRVGGVLRRLARDGEIEVIPDRYVRTSRGSAGLIRLWRRL